MSGKIRDWHEGVEPLRIVYARHCAGCCLHVIADDGNVDQEFAVHAVERAQEQGHADCLAAAEILMRMSPTQRAKLHRNYNLFAGSV